MKETRFYSYQKIKKCTLLLIKIRGRAEKSQEKKVKINKKVSNAD